MNSIKKNFGFGCMRLPMIDDEVDFDLTSKMVDEFIAQGFNYFDTAHGYIGGQSEIAVKKCLTDRYPRESYILTNKLSGWFFKTADEIRPLFQSQLDACGVDYFDYYLMHTQNRGNFPHFKECRAYETAFELKAEGKIRHVGLSFHDTAEVLEQILTEYPEIEVVQIQFNYLDYYDSAVQSKKIYEVCRKLNKPVIVMEPVKGGNLVNLPDEAKEIFDSLGNSSYASYAIRFAASFEGIFMVLSGMSNMEQMVDNTSYMADFKPLTDKEFNAIDEVRKVFARLNLIACTGCRYCTDECPQSIAIPDLFSIMNKKATDRDWNPDMYYNTLTSKSGKASSCIKCGQCEDVCPQNLPIRKLLDDIAKEFEK